LDEIQVTIWSVNANGSRSKFDLQDFVEQNYPTAGDIP